MEVYDELASCPSDEEDDYDEADALYEPSPVRKKGHLVMVQKSGHDDKENKNPHFLDLLKDGDDEKKVTVEQCKDYLRKHGLRLSGTKAVLIERIKRHLQELDTSIPAHLGVSRGPIDDELIEGFSNMDLDHINDAAIAELPKDVKKLSVEDCKAYLRKHGLRLAGTKKVLIERILEHLEIKDDKGLTKYPETSFTISCQGDACVGDVVLFNQRVYDFFNIGGRCSAGPPVGVRTIAGKIVKESYGSSKQQHTFTVEVLWSTGDRPLPPLHPLIIKGRNLYRVKTLRQGWIDETDRMKRLQEKHARGAAARKERMARIEGVKHLGISKNQTHISAPLLSGPSERDSRTSIHASNVEPVIAAVELRIKSILAGLIVGKQGVHLKEVHQISEAELNVDADAANPAFCVVTITGTAQQREVALRMVIQRTSCKFFFADQGNCKWGDTCRFLHSPPQIRFTHPST